jgi:hypothetical protein
MVGYGLVGNGDLRILLYHGCFCQPLVKVLLTEVSAPAVRRVHLDGVNHSVVTSKRQVTLVTLNRVHVCAPFRV